MPDTPELTDPLNEPDEEESVTTGDISKMDWLQSLGPYIRHGFDAAADNRKESGVEDEMLDCLRMCQSEYSDAEKVIIESKGAPTIFVPHADLKRRTANTLISEVFLNSSDQPWTLRPTPIPEVSPDDAMEIADKTMKEYAAYATMLLVEQGVPENEADAIVATMPPDPEIAAEYARKRRDEIDNMRSEEASRKVERMTKKCHDQMIEGKWHEAMTNVVDYCSTYGTGILKGPTRKMRKRVKFAGNGSCKLETVEVWEWEAINPFDAYPSKGAVEIGDGDFFQRVRYTAKELSAMAKLGDGYHADNIRDILTRYPNGGLTLEQTSDTERRRLENDGSLFGSTDTRIEGIEFWGDVRGSMLKDIGIEKYEDGEGIEDDEYYEVNAIVIDNAVVFCSLTDEKLGRPLYKGVFYRIPGSWWGESPVKKMRDVLRMYNAAARDLCVNMAQSSGPMLFVGDATRIMPGTDLKMVPWGVHTFRDPQGRGDIPVKIFQAASNSDELMGVMERMEKLIDTVTGIPAYSHGTDTAAGAGRTYNGLLLIVTASKQGANTVVYSLYLDVLKPSLNYQYRANMLFEDDPDIKGDCEVDAGGLLSILVREQSINRLLEFLQIAQNPSVMKVIGESGMAELLRNYVKLLQGVNPDNVVPSQNEMDRRQKLAEIEGKLAQAEQAASAQGQGFGRTPVAAPTPDFGVSGGQAARPLTMREASLPTEG